MLRWVWEGIRKGIVTTAYPSGEESASGVSPGFPSGLPTVYASPEEAASVVSCCPTEALALDEEERKVFFREERCIHCYRCLRRLKPPVDWQRRGSYEWAFYPADGRRAKLEKCFRRSLHLRVIDAGACGACLSEIEQINNPYYNMHRLGFFLTPTPRDADVLLVAGPVTDHMRLPLLKAYEAMPTPKAVMGLGACAIFGGIFGKSFASLGGASSLVPVDLLIPGCPPPPLAILHGLLALAGRVDARGLLPVPHTSQGIEDRVRSEQGAEGHG
jgi:Ni,Fe-hydrogenase III small subunit